MSSTLRWGILGPGNIAGQFSKGLAQAKHGELVAVASREADKARAFAEEHGAARSYGSYYQLLQDAEVDVIYVATPHPLHPEWVIAACEAGKHVLCEKPIALNAWQAEATIQAAREHGVFLMEAFMYRCHPQIARVRELVREGAIGTVQVIQASFAFRCGGEPESRIMKAELGGGGILDVGCYPMSFARLIAGAATGGDVAEPESVVGEGHVGETGVDEWASALLRFDGDLVAEVATGVRQARSNDAVIFGTEGRITVTHPWRPDQGEATLIIQRGKEREEERFDDGIDLFAYEADAVAAHLADGQCPHMRWDDTLGNMRTLDRWRAELGVVYPQERVGGGAPARGVLERRDDAPMIYGSIPGLDKQVSRLVMGCDNQTSVPHGDAMWDDWYERGGNAFDTAFIYGGGRPEGLLGQWQEKRGVRDRIVILGKGAHTPHCQPESIAKQLDESLERLRTDYLDVYCLHRDNPEFPVGEFIDALNEEVDRGRIRVFGGSNWSIERIAEANAYAKTHGKQGFTVLSNNFSLARMVDPVWKGCVSASDPESRKWLEDEQFVLMPWSSQARGFFLRADPSFTDDEELTRCWYSDGNFQRLERAREIASRKGVQPIQVALAYVLNQPFPTFPLIGPRHICETASSLQGIDVQLSAEELAYLSLDAEAVGA